MSIVVVYLSIIHAIDHLLLHKALFFHNFFLSYQFPEKQPDFREGALAPDSPGEVVAAAVEALGGAVDGGDLGLACKIRFSITKPLVFLLK